jgi:hypothetical protein
MNLTVINDFPPPRNSWLKLPDFGGSRCFDPIDAAGEKDLTLPTTNVLNCASYR